MTTEPSTPPAESAEPTAPNPEEPPLDIHKPKPVHSWREFLSEIGVIVIGVLIALGAEQTVEAIHTAHLAEQERHDVRAEASINLAFVKRRADQGSCIEKRLDEIETLLRNPALSLGNPPLWIGRPVQMPVFNGRWHAATSSARISLFSSDEQGLFDNLYAVLDEGRLDIGEEQSAWTDLRVLEKWRGPIDPATRFTLLRALAAARHADYQFRVHSHFAFKTAGELSVKPNPRFARPPEGAIDSLCLPSDTPADVAQRQMRDVIHTEY